MSAGWLGRLRARPERRDAAIALFWLVAGLVLWAFGIFGMWQNLAVLRVAPWGFLLTLAAMAALVLLRSRHPFLALGLGVIVATLDSLMGASLAVVFIFTDLIYAAIKYGSARGVRILVRIAAAAAVALALAVALVSGNHPGLGIMLFQWGLIILVSGLWGWNVRSERVLTRAELAVQHAADTRELRTRIAHDLHDLVANQIAVAGLHIEAAKLQLDKLQSDKLQSDKLQSDKLQSDKLRGVPANEPGPLSQSLDRAKRGTERAHHELRGLISVLTVVDEVEARAPARLTEELPALSQLLPAGRSITWADGAGERIREALPPADATRARIVLRALHELVANAAKHGAGDLALGAELAGASGADLGAERGLRVTLENPVSPRPRAAPPSTGLGVEGTRVLLASLGGTLDSHAVPGGWWATLSLPPRHDTAGGTR